MQEEYNLSQNSEIESDVRDLNPNPDSFIASQEVKWQLPPGEYEKLSCLVDQGMIVLVGKQKNPSEGDGRFAFTKISYKRPGNNLGSINLRTWNAKYIKNGLITNAVGVVTDSVVNTMHIQYNRGTNWLDLN